LNWITSRDKGEIMNQKNLKKPFFIFAALFALSVTLGVESTAFEAKPASDGKTETRDIIKAARLSVVNIYYDGGKKGRLAARNGSGFVIRGDGYVVSNRHIVEGLKTVLVQFVDQTSYTATVVGTDPAFGHALSTSEARRFQSGAAGRPRHRRGKSPRI
jgi:S1-C subfamily serine protease